MLRSLPTGPSKTALAVSKQRAYEQATVNDLYRGGNIAGAEAELRYQARAMASKYEEYDSAVWVLGVATALVEVRDQTVAKLGDIILLGQDVSGVVSFYSVRVAHKCVAGAGVRPVSGWDKAFDHWHHELGASSGKGTQVLRFVAKAIGTVEDL